MSNINNNLSVGANSLVKRVASGTGNTGTGNIAPKTSGYGTDSLVRNGATAAVGNSANATATAALDRLATCYDASPEVFARNLAEATLNDVCRLVG